MATRCHSQYSTVVRSFSPSDCRGLIFTFGIRHNADEASFPHSVKYKI